METYNKQFYLDRMKESIILVENGDEDIEFIVRVLDYMLEQIIENIPNEASIDAEMIFEPGVVVEFSAIKDWKKQFLNK